ncbi:ABC transporter permease [Roseateles sp.]|uniref:ABC transporter permease n=1 Tax=Roseateles sp. TaxID=1971397 RepID=UPI003BA5CDC8
METSLNMHPGPFVHWFRWLRGLSWPVLRHQAGRQSLALVAIVLGVALAYAVHLLNSSALAEFGRAAASINGQADLIVERLAEPGSAGISESDYARIANLPDLVLAAPRLEGQAQMSGADGKRFNLTVIGLDFLQAAALSPELMPLKDSGSAEVTAMHLLDPERLLLNDAALRKLGARPALSSPITLRVADASTGQAHNHLALFGGRHSAGGAPVAVMDIAGAQLLLGRLGRIDRIDLRLSSGIAADEWLARVGKPGLPPGLQAKPPSDDGAWMGQITRAYRVNLGVLSLMALFSGSFLVFAVISLSVSQRLPQLALLGVLGMSASERGRLILAEGMVLGAIGSGLGLLLGWALADLGLRQVLAGDLGLAIGIGGSQGLSFDAGQHLPAAAGFGLLGLLISVLASALPALSVRRMPVAQVLKGLGHDTALVLPGWLGPALLLLGLALALLPPLPVSSGWANVPLAAYAAMLSLLLGGIACVPSLLRACTRLLRARPHSATLLLVREHAQDQAGAATRALAGILVALSLSVAMLVMVGSFRTALQGWLEQMLPADLYLRSSLRVAEGQTAPLPPELIAKLHDSGLAEQVLPQYSGRLWLPGHAEPLALMARKVREDDMPWVGALAAAPQPGAQAVYINEAMRDSLNLQPGQMLVLSLDARQDGPVSRPADSTRQRQVFVRGVWRDYARQSSALIMDLADYRAWSGNTVSTEVLLWLRPGDRAADLVPRIRSLAQQPEDLELASLEELRSISLHIFDRSFAVTLWLQSVALAIGLFGIAASQSAQALARKREFGLLWHLGLSRAGILRLLAWEAVLLCGVGALAGLALGVGLSAVLVFVVNPQSFHWSMELSLPWRPLLGLVAAVFVAGVATTLLAGRQALSAQAVQAVKEDW